MQYPKADITLESVNSRTFTNRRIVESMEKKLKAFHADADAEKRLKKHVCRACYYIASGVAGQAITTRPCGVCGEEQVYPSTNTDVLCERCARAAMLCAHCGGDIKMMERVKL